jgi:micrococcal nuclease
VNPLLAFAGAHKVAVAVVTVVVGAGVINAMQPTTATIERVVDGDTVDVIYGGEEHRVRLLNIDTPEAVDPNQPVECLGPEASAFLRELLPEGTEVTLKHDNERKDRYDRELAAVYKGDLFISAEIARAGLGVAVVIGDNDRYFREVAAAQEEARLADRGLYATEPECTLPAQVQALDDAATAAQSEVPVTSAIPSATVVDGFESHAAEVAALAVTARSLLRTLGGDVDILPLRAFDENTREVMRRSVEQSTDRIESTRSRTDRELSRARQAWADKQEAERRAAEEAAQLAEAQRAAEEAARQAAEDAARRASEAASQRASSRPRTYGSSGSSGTSRPAPTSAPSGGGSSSGGSSSGGGGGGYTGCRSYAPGGGSWTPIPC